jgi:hypothetical protein
MAIVQTAAENSVHVQCLNSNATEHDIRDAVEGAHLVEMNGLRRLAMDLSFRHGDPVKNRNRMLFYECGQLAGFDERPNLRVSATFFVKVMVGVPVALSMFMRVFMVALVVVMLVVVAIFVSMRF